MAVMTATRADVFSDAAIEIDVTAFSCLFVSIMLFSHNNTPP